MKPKQLVILLVLAIALVGLAVVTSRRERATAAPPVLGGLILPDLPVNDVTRIAIVNQGATATVERIDGAWKVAEMHGYRASFDRVRASLIALAELKIGDQRQTTPQTRQEFGLVAPDPAHPDATRIDLEGAGGKALASLLLGKHHVRKSADAGPYGGNYPDGRYVSPDDGITAYLVKPTLSDFTATPMSWIDTELLNVDGAELVRIAIGVPDGEPVELATQNGSALTVTGVTDNEEIDDSKLTAVRGALTYLTLQDVANPAQPDAELGFDKPTTFTAYAQDGRVFHLQLGGPAEGGARYLRCRVEFVAPAAPASEATETNAPPDPDHTAAQQATEALNTKLAGWTYVIPSYKAEAMVVKRSDLVKPKPPAETESATPAATAEPQPVPAEDAPAAPTKSEAPEAPEADAPEAPAVESPDAGTTTPNAEEQP